MICVQGWSLRAADDISCAAVPVVSFITAFYYCLLISGNIVDSDDVDSLPPLLEDVTSDSLLHS